MDWVTVALGIIVIIGILEGIYLLIKSRREGIMFGEEEGYRKIRIKIWDALKLGFGFTLGMFIFLGLMVVLFMLLQRIGFPLSLPELPLSIPI